MISLDTRLKTIADMVGKCATLADIGADHGRLGAYLLKNELCARVCFTDISQTSLDKARRLITRMGLNERADFVIGDGADALEYAPDAAVIAGMGGVTISEIVEAGHKLADARLILQPNVAIYDMRRRLTRAGYEITDEKLARAGGRFYVVVAMRRGPAEYDERELLVGPVLIRRADALLKDYAAFRARVARKAARGACASDIARADMLIREAEIWEEL